MSDADRTGDLNRHYGRSGLAESILDALASMGKRLEGMTPAELAPVDEFHIRGLEATRELSRWAGIRPGDRVLDIGGGLGGPARVLASECRAQVEVLDLTEEFCRSGRILTRGLGMEGQVSFRHGSGLEPPYADHTFDVVWMQHCTMNVEDKPRLFRETHRVLRPEGRLVLHEVLAGKAEPLEFPVPWADVPDLSFLVPEPDYLEILGSSGFHRRRWEDVSASSTQWFRDRFRERTGTGPPPILGPQLLFPGRPLTPFTNMLRNLEEGRARVIQGIWLRE